MAIFTPETLRSILFPTFFVYRFFGMGAIEFPVGRRRWILSLIYSLAICICYAIVLFISYDLLSIISHYLGSSVATFAFRIFALLNFLMMIAHFASSMVRNKDHTHYVIELMKIDTAIQEMGAARSYQPSSAQKIRQFLGYSFIWIIVFIWDYFYIVQSSRIAGYFTGILLWYIFDYPVLLSFFCNMTFYVFNRTMTQYLEDLNLLLQSMGIDHPDGYETRMGNLIRVEAIQEDKHKLEKLRRVRKIYFRLMKLAKRWTELNGLQVVSSTILAVWLGTFHVYGLWRAFLEPEFKFEMTVAILQSLKAIAFHTVKLYLIVCSTTALKVKARQTCGILLTYLQPIAFLRMEVNEFALQLIQNPVRLSAGGLFDLDYTLIHMVITNIATYLVVLVQTNNLSTATNSTSIRRTSD